MADRVIENIVASADIEQQLPLQALSVSIPGTEFNEQDPILIFRFEHPKRAVLITEQGKITCTGVTSVDDGKKTIYEVIETLRQHAIAVQQDPEVYVESYVISIHYNNSLDLQEIQRKLPSDQIIFDLQRNPWIEYLYDEHVSFLICSSGTIVCTGKGSLDHADHAIEMLSSLLE